MEKTCIDCGAPEPECGVLCYWCDRAADEEAAWVLGEER